MTQNIKISVGVIIILIVIATVGLFVWNIQKNKEAVPAVIPVASVNNMPASTSTPDITSVPVDETVDWQIYKDDKYGFELKYPQIVKLITNSKDWTQKIKKISIIVTDINSTKEDGPMGYNSSNFLKDREVLKRGGDSVHFDFPVQGSEKKLNWPGILGREFVVERRFETCDVTLERHAIIYRGDAVIHITWEYGDMAEFIKNNPAYFKVDNGCKVVGEGPQKAWKDGDAAYSDLQSGKADVISQEWFRDFDKVMSTIKFTK